MSIPILRTTQKCLDLVINPPLKFLLSQQAKQRTSIRNCRNFYIGPQIGAKMHSAAGCTNQMQSFVSKYQSTAQAPVLEYNVGQGIFQNGNPSESITNEFSIDSNGRISGPNNLNLTIAGSVSFKGSARNPLTGKVISFSGVVLQQQQFARGFFLDGDQSGSVYFGP